MKILGFFAKGVHDAFTFNIAFNSDLNFLVGINGSGKTTALKLMQAALTLNLRELYLVRFSEIKIDTYQNDRLKSIVFVKQPDQIKIFIQGDEAAAETLPVFPPEEIDQYLKTGKFDDLIQELRFRLLRSASTVSKFFQSLPKPIFLGLERRLLRDEDMAFEADDAFLNRSARMHFSDRPRRQEQSIDGLESTKSLLQEAYRKFRTFSDRASESLVNVLVESAFKYIDFDPGNFEHNRIKHKEHSEVFARRREIEEAASSLGGTTKTSGQIADFFKKMQELYDHSARRGAQDNVSIEWLLNRSQIQRMSDILTELDRHKKRALGLYAPISRFVDTANAFFQDSRKTVSVDSVGHLVIKHKEKDVPLPSLSSGERQLLIIIAHVVLRAKREGGVIIIDEPELSLHLRWQEKLVEKLVELNDTMQFIFATHSPEIVGEYKNKAVQLFQ
jgi:predicted ATP-binding protein involved in virulence